MVLIKSISIGLFCFSILGTGSLASDTSIGSNEIRILNPFIFLHSKNPKSVAGYFKLKNNNSFNIILSDVKADLGKSMIHKTVTNNSGIVKMVHLKEVEIKANEIISFEPGSYHIMFTKLQKKLVKGDIILGRLIFNNDLQIEIAFKVETPESFTTKKSKHNH
jgi:copper(I)-binding protein